MCTGPRFFFARFSRLELSAPFVEAWSGNPELLGQIIDAFTGLHPLYGRTLKLPGISLPSLHWCFLSRRVCPSRLCQFKGSFHLDQTKRKADRLRVSLSLSRSIASVFDLKFQTNNLPKLRTLVRFPSLAP